MESEEKRVWTIQRDDGEPLPAPIAALVERWLTLTDGDPIAALVIAAEELTLRCDDRRAAPISFFEAFEQIVTGAGVERLKAEVVEDEEIGAAEGFDEARMTPIAAREAAKGRPMPITEDRSSGQNIYYPILAACIRATSASIHCRISRCMHAARTSRSRRRCV